MTAYYNELDPYAAQWLRNLIATGHIAPGEVDERSISDVKPADLAGFTQCHFFAGIGVWSLALRRAGWLDHRPVWTGSCPCQPFSAAGSGAGFADERHLWPHWYQLIAQCRPHTIFGEQVASKDGLAWLDLVLSDLENAGYAAAALDLCAAGVGHPVEPLPDVRGADAMRAGRPERRPRSGVGPAAGGGSADRMDNADNARLEGPGRRHQAEGGRVAPTGSASTAGEFGGLADTHRNGRHQGRERGTEAGGYGAFRDGTADRPGPTNGHWRAADWLGCRDGKWRPVEPGAFPLAHGVASRVGRLRAYGNAIVAPLAEEVIRAFLDADQGR